MNYEGSRGIADFLASSAYQESKSHQFVDLVVQNDFAVESLVLGKILVVGIFLGEFGFGHKLGFFLGGFVKGSFVAGNHLHIVKALVGFLEFVVGQLGLD